MKSGPEMARAAVAASVLLVLASACGAARPDDAGASARDAGDPSPTLPGMQLAAVAPAAARRPPELIGLSREQLSRLLGVPTLLRRESPAEVWQYVGAGCVLHVFLYQEPGGSRVTYYDSAGSGGRRVAARDCYDRLFEESGRRAGES